MIFWFKRFEDNERMNVPLHRSWTFNILDRFMTVSELFWSKKDHNGCNFERLETFELRCSNALDRIGRNVHASKTKEHLWLTYERPFLNSDFYTFSIISVQKLNLRKCSQRKIWITKAYWKSSKFLNFFLMKLHV